MPALYSALSPVAAAVYAALNVSSVTMLATGGVHDDVPQSTAMPLVLFDLAEQFKGGFGTRPGQNGFWEVNLRLHVYSTYQGWKEAQDILAACIETLATPIVVSGMACHAIFHTGASQLPDQILAGIKCKELVQDARLMVEATS